MHKNKTDRNELVSVALGERPAELVVTGGQLVNVYSGEIYPADVAVIGTRIAVVGEVSHCIGPETERLDAAGCYLVPGLIDCHIHVGATGLVMTEFARLVVPHGTAAIVTDFTEAGKMQGVPAIRFFLEEAAETPLKVYLSPFYTTLLGIDGRAAMNISEMREMLSWPECIELREWNVFAQRHPREELRSLADFAREKRLLICGHLEGQEGMALQASVSSGVTSDHEAGTAEDALERIRLGVAVQMRFASSADDMAHVLKAITQHRFETRFFMFSTDEEDIDDIGIYGHLDHRVRTTIAMGISPIEAIRMGSLNAAAYLGQSSDLGGIAPGRTAFINLVEDLSDFQISQVIYGSSVVAEDGRYSGQTSKPDYPSSFYNTIRLRSRLHAAEFQIQCSKDSGPVNVRVIQVTPRQARTQEKVVSLSARNGRVDPNPELDVAKISVVERHVGSGEIANAFLKGLGLRKGALGISYQPGPLHIGIVGMNDADMAVAANRIAELGGGFVAVSDGRILAEVALPVLGFLSAESAEDVLAGFRRVKTAIRQNLGISIEGLYTTLAYVFMPGAIPEIRMSINGLVRIAHIERSLSITPVSLFVEQDYVERSEPES